MAGHEFLGAEFAGAGLSVDQGDFMNSQTKKGQRKEINL